MVPHANAAYGVAAGRLGHLRKRSLFLRWPFLFWYNQSTMHSSLYNESWFEKRAYRSLKKIDNGLWDYSDSKNFEKYVLFDKEQTFVGALLN